MIVNFLIEVYLIYVLKITVSFGKIFAFLSIKNDTLKFENIYQKNYSMLINDFGVILLCMKYTIQSCKFEKKNIWTKSWLCLLLRASSRIFTLLSVKTDTIISKA